MANYQLLEPFQFNNGVSLKNKVVMAPMTTMSSFYNGKITQDELNYFAARAGGPGMVITSVANVSEIGKGFEGELSVASDDMLPGLTKLAATIKKDGAKAILQIFNAGRKSTTSVLRGETPVSASAVAAEFPPESETPRALEQEEIEQIIVDFGTATRRAIQAGFDGVELHGANTYLLQQFYSAHSNRRTDEWGATLEKRMKFPLAVIKEVTETIKQYAPSSFLLGYRVSPEEVETPGIRLEDTLYLAKQIQNQIDYLHLFMGSYKRTSLNDPNDTTPILEQFAARVGRKTPLIGIGSVETPEDANEVLDNGGDLVAVGRELLREPQWVQKIQSGDEASIRNTMSLSDMEELSIPGAMQTYLQESFGSVMNFTPDGKKAENYQNQAAPMEGFEKKL
ncbi:NADH-dependent flavin oxidoreductase [Tetragenococcus koreensis]|uniref:NADH-dependent flavin oxidoreductase n=1 Tax=Tetragenococcus koreensis TaxID=290335 RepID=A0AAN4UAM0_9ENTE|nr:NADH-dependent flavin oxidoreductase [Tetragenococcus koreensis]MDN6840609.1 NADH-dependent flavin oxidoreductase [Tetragenococcus halophilus]MCF1586215.1 NADH-dependent flavin oxidoreductase [Tetragenococcus koreensis]MCF1615798.1 NADH-dependent flavin oxidoreductase [Tetragenococcus koreensis]MCF1620715.1 NADH-dependent flavin oxidoreductase [Tetragenococcus koreensis]MCF1625588.1 NADH-dependent flavin oxidoreductase [Tetragenococcus koreensis]